MKATHSPRRSLRAAALAGLAAAAALVALARGDRVAHGLLGGAIALRWLAQRGLERGRIAAAGRILAAQNVVDAFGHVSLRHPSAPDRYLMAKSISPARVTPEDIIEYDLDSKPLDAGGRESVRERYWDAAGDRPLTGVLVALAFLAGLRGGAQGGPIALEGADVNAAVEHGAQRGEVELAEAVIERVPSIEMLRLVSSGTEAAMTAVPRRP